MNVYDFDKTIYRGDSTLDFFRYCLKRKPGLLRYVPAQAWFFVIYSLGLIDKTRFKEGFYLFLRGIPDMDAFVADFWEKQRSGILDWYLQRQQPTDLVISASPQFLLAPICADLGIRHLIASKVDPRTGAYSGKNCYGPEKVSRLQKEFPNQKIDRFYSDSHSDAPLAELAEEAFLVAKGKPLPWPQQIKNSAKGLFLNREFSGFIIVGAVNTFNGVLFAWLFSLFLEAQLAWVIGYACSLIISYLLNSFLIFKSSLSLLRFIKFVISYIPNFLVQFASVLVIYGWLGWHKLVAYILAALIGVPVTFLMLKLYAFLKK